VISVPLPFPLGEMAGRFRTKVEHTVSLMQSIVFKMDTSGHPIKQNIREGLNELREKVWRTSVEVPDGLLEYLAGRLLVLKVRRPMLKYIKISFPSVIKLVRPFMRQNVFLHV
jgi:hypothetical protein